MCVAAIVLDVMAKALIVATTFLRFCRAGSDGVAFMVGASGVNCIAGRIYTGSGLFVAWAVDL